jgi:hypothetical protein
MDTETATLSSTRLVEPNTQTTTPPEQSLAADRVTGADM